MHFTRSLVVLAATLLPLLTAAPLPSVNTNSIATSRAGETVSDSYIVVLKKDVGAEAFEAHIASTMSLHSSRLVRRNDNTLTGVEKKYSFGNFKGYSGCFDSSTIEQIKNNTEVDFIEADQIMVAKSIVTQTKVPSWGLPRVSQKQNVDFTKYFYDSSAGQGVTAYVIDTGINTSHKDFQGRATWGYNAADGVNEDGVGHGTHVAGTIGGATYGIAKKVSLIAVKVLGSDGSGTNSGVLKGIEWVISDAQSKGTAAKSVANMSLGGSYSAALNQAVEEAVSAGITFAVAAGNENVDAANSSPASAKSAITVGAIDQDDSRASYSNFGSVVDVFAPGTDITSAWIGSDTAVNTISGTSMATPHVAGLAAYLIAFEGLSGASAVTARILQLATSGVVSGASVGTTNSLVNNGSGH